MYKFRVTTLFLNKQLPISLKYIYGASWCKIFNLLAALGISLNFSINSLNFYYRDLVIFYLSKLVLSKARIERGINLNIAKLKEAKTYRGFRHKFSLPVRGQRSRSNANTQRSKRKGFQKKNVRNGI
jgi:small subunit ribosomal protein S13